MEAGEGPSAGVTVIGAEAPSNYYVLPIEENPCPEVAGMVPPMAEQHREAGSRNTGDLVGCSAGAKFIPHIITANAGEDIMSKIISFSVERSQATCILSGHGVISQITLRRPDSPLRILTYEEPFQILKMTGSFAPTLSGGTRSWTGGVSATLVSQDGRIFGGLVAGLVVAASPVQVVVGSILPRNQRRHKLKKARNESTTPKLNVASPSRSSGMNFERIEMRRE